MFDDELKVDQFECWEPSNKVTTTSLNRLMKIIKEDQNFTEEEKAIHINDDIVDDLQIIVYLERKYEFPGVSRWMSDYIKEINVKIHRCDELCACYVEINQIQVGLFTTFAHFSYDENGNAVLQIKTGVHSLNEKNINTRESIFAVDYIENLSKYIAKIYLYASKLLKMYNIKEYVITDPIQIIF